MRSMHDASEADACQHENTSKPLDSFDLMAPRHAGAASDVAFHVNRFAFPALFATHDHYISVIQRDAPLLQAKAPRVTEDAWSRVMKFFSRFFARRETNLTTALERQRLSRTMPGQTAAMAGVRLGVLVN